MAKQFYTLILRGNINYPRESIEKTLRTMLGKDFFKKFPKIEKSGVFANLVRKLYNGDSQYLTVGSDALERLMQINRSLLDKGLSTVLTCSRKAEVDLENTPAIIVLSRICWDGASAYLRLFDADGDDLQQGNHITEEELKTMKHFLVSLPFNVQVSMYDTIHKLLAEAPSVAIAEGLILQQNFEHVVITHGEYITFETNEELAEWATDNGYFSPYMGVE